jgi:hypothetical protein
LRAGWIETLSKIETISRNVGYAITPLLEHMARRPAGFGMRTSIDLVLSRI